MSSSGALPRAGQATSPEVFHSLFCLHDRPIAHIATHACNRGQNAPANNLKLDNMYCDPLLKLNKFRYVKLPKPKDYVARFGLHDFNGQYSGENATLPTDNRKISTLSRLVSINDNEVRNDAMKAMQMAQQNSQNAPTE